MKEKRETLYTYFETIPERLVISNPRSKQTEYKKIQIRRLDNQYFVEQYTQKQVFHKKIEFAELTNFVEKLPLDAYKQIDMWDKDTCHAILIGKDGLLHWTQKADIPKTKIMTKSQNRKKNYLLEEGTIIEPLVDMGIFTAEGKVVRSMYDKFKQINRFIEIVDDEVQKLPRDKELHIIDFGCGKSYLTFIVYYYFKEIRNQKVKMIGLDLKEDVIHNCNRAAKKYGYSDLQFEVGDINGYKVDFDVDIVMTLHACDVATDYALYNAIEWNASLILSVPCCQHELNKQIETTDLSLLTRYGIVQDRFAALLTDTIRANLLHYCGYKTQIMEFVDLSHTPKNLLIRAHKTSIPQKDRKRYLQEVERAMETFHVQPTLYELLKRKIG